MLAAVGDQSVPEVVHLFLGLDADEEGDRLVELILGTAIEGCRATSNDMERKREFCAHIKLRFDSSLIDDGPCRFDFPLVELVEYVLRKGYLAPINLKAEETSLGRAVKSQAARDVRRLADQEVNVEMKVRDFTKIPLQHF